MAANHDLWDPVYEQLSILGTLCDCANFRLENVN